MTHINTRRGSSGAWSSENPVLMLGEVGIETDTQKTKQGDGTTAWNSLPYASAPFANAALTGTPTAPTPPDGNNSTRIATTQFVQATLADKANLDSPTFSGTPSAPTPSPGDDDTSLATTAFVQEALATALEDAVTETLLASHPIGSIYMSINSANPSTLFGGTWVAWGSGRVPVGVDAGETAFDTVEETGGALTHTHDLDSATSGARIRISDSDTQIQSFSKAGTLKAMNSRVNGADNTGDPGDSTSMVSLEGLSDPSSSLQPYITCYMFKRTA